MCTKSRSLQGFNAYLEAVKWQGNSIANRLAKEKTIRISTAFSLSYWKVQLAKKSWIES
jgi:hypothetical protein